MKEIHYKIVDPDGIHARPAGNLVKLAQSFESTITLACNGKSADAKKLFALMGLGVKKGMTVTLCIEGVDEENAMNQLAKYLSENL